MQLHYSQPSGENVTPLSFTFWWPIAWKVPPGLQLIIPGFRVPTVPKQSKDLIQTCNIAVW